jgi:beta-lactamase class A
VIGTQWDCVVSCFVSRATLRCDAVSSVEGLLSVVELEHVSFALVDSGGVTRLEHRAGQGCYAASIMKLAAAVAVLRALDEGRLSPDDQLTYNGGFASGLDGSHFTIDDDSIDEGLFASTGIGPAPITKVGDGFDNPAGAEPAQVFAPNGDTKHADGVGQGVANRERGFGSFSKDGEVFPAHWIRRESPPGVPGDGLLIVSVARALRRSITVSSNEAANLLIEAVGLEAINSVLRKAGCENSVVERMVFDIAARDAGRTNTLTARDAAQLVWSIRFGTIAAKDSLAYLCEVLRAQTQRSMTPFALSEALMRGRVLVGNKEGQTNEVLHDVAFLEPDDADPFVLAVCTVGLTEAEATDSVRKVARYAYDHRLSWKSFSEDFR